jgi:hypothetical protein
MSQSSLLSIVDPPKKDSELHHKHTFCNPFYHLQQTKQVAFRALESGYWLFLLHKTNPQTLMTISAGITKGMKLRFWIIAMMFFQVGLGSVMESQILKTQAWVWGQLPNVFVLPWYQRTRGGSFKI